MCERHEGAGPVRAMVLERPGHIALHTVQEPDAEADHVRLQIGAVGVCGTDRSIYRGSIPVRYPRVLGHEIVGTIMEQVGGWTPGDRAIVDPNVVCGVCARCTEGRENLCERGWLLGRDRDGGMQETMRVPVANLHRVPLGLPDHLAPLIQVLSTCQHAHEMARSMAGACVVVIGLGVSGLLHVQLAAAAGASMVIGVSRSPAKRTLGKTLGADVTISAALPDVRERINEVHAGGGDIVIECVGTAATLAQAVHLTRYGGEIVAYGTITETEATFPFYELYHKELVISNPRAATRVDVAAALETVTRGSVDLAPLVTDRVSFDRVDHVLAAGAGADSLKTVIEP
ncbi:MAG TPA: alcohol dehydrogenase catalytic domain-containing protein [Actinomycetota bacterium]